MRSSLERFGLGIIGILVLLNVVLGGIWLSGSFSMFKGKDVPKAATPSAAPLSAAPAKPSAKAHH